jgi:hypothetical protein
MWKEGGRIWVIKRTNEEERKTDLGKLRTMSMSYVLTNRTHRRQCKMSSFKKLT